MCANDSAGANDQPGQKDLTKACVNDTNSLGALQVTWNWDEISWTGNNTGDACALFDTDGDGFVNYSVCVVVGGNPATAQSYRIYSCGDARIDRCSQSISLLPSPYTTVCTVSDQSPDDPFDATVPIGPGDAYPYDTKADCSIGLADFGSDGATAQLIDVCSYPSQQPNADPSDCVNYRPSSGRLEVKKVVDPTNDPGKFNLFANNTSNATVASATDVGDGGTTTSVVVSAGNHTVFETAGTNTNLVDYVSSISCRDQNGTGNDVGSCTNCTSVTPVSVADGADVVCIITNVDPDPPLSVSLSDFSAICQVETPLISWETVSEIETMGFNLFRGPSASGWDTQLNTTMIPAQFPGSTQGGVYHWLDTTTVAGGSYFYYLQDISLTGAVTLHDPVSATCIAPTAVRLAGLDTASSPAGPLPWWTAALAMMAALGGLAAWQRRAKA